MKNLPNLTRETEEKNRTRNKSIKKLLKQMIKIKGKTNRWIDKKLPDPIRTKEEN